MGRFVLYTHTRWDEAARIRHQIARLLRDAGHDVLFIERGLSAWQGPPVGPALVEPGIWLARPTRLMHHQIRLMPSMHRIEAGHASAQCTQAVDRWCGAAEHTIVNFALDGWFLRDAFPKNRIVTVIHDDFEAQSRLPFRGHITWPLARTCRMSNDVFAVSVPLVERLSSWCAPQLLLPWAVDRYRPPTNSAMKRDVLLFWGTIDNAIDLNMVKALSARLLATRPAAHIMLVGPTQTAGARDRIVQELSPCANLTIHGRTNLDDLPLERVLAGILPYRRSPAVDCVTLANKSMQILARGIPLAISAMPAFLQKPFIVRLDGAGGIDEALNQCEASALRWQPAICEFCAENDPASALHKLGVVSIDQTRTAD